MDAAKVSKMGVMEVRESARAGVEHLRDRVEPAADRFKIEAASRVESVAGEIRRLGEQLDRSEEAHVLARRLERTADYLRYRPTFDMAEDAWAAVTRPRVLWVIGGFLAGVVSYRLIRGWTRGVE